MKNEIAKTSTAKIEQYQSWIDRQLELRKFAPMLPDFGDLPGELRAESNETYECAIAWNNDHIDQANTIAKKAGWDFESFYENLSGSWGSYRNFHYRRYIGDKTLKLTLHAEADNKLATCKIVEIGQETVTREEKIYEVTCPEGAEEKAFA